MCSGSSSSFCFVLSVFCLFVCLFFPTSEFSRFIEPVPKLRHEHEAKCEVAEITAREHGSVQNPCHRYKDLSALVVNFGENERNSMEENKSLFV